MRGSPPRPRSSTARSGTASPSPLPTPQATCCPPPSSSFWRAAAAFPRARSSPCRSRTLGATPAAPAPAAGPRDLLWCATSMCAGYGRRAGCSLPASTARSSRPSTPTSSRCSTPTPPRSPRTAAESRQLRTAPRSARSSAPTTFRCRMPTRRPLPLRACARGVRRRRRITRTAWHPPPLADPSPRGAPDIPDARAADVYKI